MKSLNAKPQFLAAITLALSVAPLASNANKLNAPIGAEKSTGGRTWEGNEPVSGSDPTTQGQADGKRRAEKLKDQHGDANASQIGNAARHPNAGRRAHKLDKSHSDATRDQVKKAVDQPTIGRRVHKLDKKHPEATRGQLTKAASHPKATRKKQK